MHRSLIVAALLSVTGAPIPAVAGTGSPANDACADAIETGLGAVLLTNVGATTDGPVHAACDRNGDDDVQADVWFVFSATATGSLIVTTCGTADFDTKIAVYEGDECPVTDRRLLACEDDTEDCAIFTTTLGLEVVAGQAYLIRVGGWLGTQGTGILTLATSSDPCPPDIDDNGSVGLTDLVAILSFWGPCRGCRVDLDGDGSVGLTDLVAVLAGWGPCP